LRKSTVWVLVVGAGLSTYACDKLPLLAPQESKITLSSSNTIVQANGVTEIRATVLEQSGTPVQNGTTVTFTSTLGSLTPNDARTLNGVALTQFRGNGQSGKATIKAISGSAASDALELSVGAAATGRVSLTANPSSVPSSGGTTTITAVAVDASSNPIANVPVTFSTTTGSFSAQVVNTDLNGRASTVLTTSREATVTATAGAITSSGLTISVSVRPTVSIAVASGTTPTRGGITTLSVTVNTATGGAPLQSVVVSYGDGSSDDLGAVSGTVSVQHVYGDDGTFTPSVTATDTSGATATASTVIVVQPVLVSISASPQTTPRLYNFTANVTAGVTVASYTWTFGDGTSDTTTGAVTSHLYATAGNKEVTVTIRTSTNVSAKGVTTVTVP